VKKCLALLALGLSSVMAQAATPTTDSIISTATSAFEAAGALTVIVVGFYIGVRLVKKIRG